jgi:hypothetical protein
MNLGELIEFLRRASPGQRVANGFGGPRSYRGYYEDVAFEPAENVTLGSMLAHAETALGATFTGYKGGEFTMNESTDTWVAERGNTGDMVTERWLEAEIALAESKERG